MPVLDRVSFLSRPEEEKNRHSSVSAGVQVAGRETGYSTCFYRKYTFQEVACTLGNIHLFRSLPLRREKRYELSVSLSRTIYVGTATLRTFFREFEQYTTYTTRIKFSHRPTPEILDTSLVISPTFRQKPLSKPARGTPPFSYFLSGRHGNTCFPFGPPFLFAFT